MIIGLIGKVGSGKDTIANMLDYIIFKDDVSNKESTYEGWKLGDVNDFYLPCFAFGDNVKKVVSDIYSIPLRYFYIRDYKDNYYYCLSTGEFTYKSEIRGCKVLTELNKDNIDLILNPNVYFKLRHLLQFVGTDLCKNLLGNHVWIKSTLKNIQAKNAKVSIITDVRFQDEADAIINADKDSVVIKLINTTEFDNNKSDHASENVDAIQAHDIDETIKWDGTVNAALFVTVKDIYYKHIKPKLK